MIMTPEKFEELGRHLAEIDPILNQFCQQYGFTQAPPHSLGRYPRRRINSNKTINLYCQIDMENRDRSQCFTEFYPDIPYAIATGGWVDIDGIRYSKSGRFFRQIAFPVLKQHLACFLEDEFSRLRNWNIDTLQQTGKGGRLAHREQRTQQSDKETIAKQAELAKHLTEINFVMNWFCQEFGFTPVTSFNLNDMPIKVIRHAPVNLFFEFKQDSVQDKDSFSVFVPEVSYTLNCGAWINIEGIQYHKTLIIFKNWPLFSVEQDFFHFLLLGYEYINNWTVEFVKATGNT